LSYWKIGLGIFGGMALLIFGVAVGGALNVTWNGKFEITPAEFVTLILTSISVLLALLTIFLGVFAIIGWKSINDGVRNHSMAFLSDQLKEGKPMFALIQTAAMSAMYNGIQTAEKEQPFDDPADSDGAGDDE
jgi:hypothetical protein